jgi:hypothetical protein
MSNPEPDKMNFGQLVKAAAYDMPDRDAVVTRQGWVEYGKDDKFPNYLYELYRSSATHNALCNGIADMAYARGLDVVSDDALTRARVLDVLEDDCGRKAMRDLKIYGRCYLHVRMTTDGEDLFDVEHVPFRKVRAGKKVEGDIVKWWVSEDFSDSRKKENRPIEYQAWKPGVRDGIHAISLFSQDDEYYPDPDYIGALSYVALEKLISDFHLNNLENGLFPSFHIHHSNGVPDAETRAKIRTEYEQKLGGAGNAGAFILTFSDGQERKTELTPIQLADSDKQYTFLSEESTKKIMIGHRVTSPLLFGIRDSSGLGSNKDEMDSAMALMTKNVLQGYRDALTKGFEEVMGVRFIIKTEQETRMSIHVDDKRPVIAEDEQDSVLEGLRKIAQSREELEKDYRVIDEEFFDGEPYEDSHYTKCYAFAINPRPGEDSTLDRGFYLVRYAYVVGSGPEVKETTRTFCKTMMTEFKDSIFRKEDINQMSFSRANPEFGTYSIWKYKGSYNCRHRWKRMVYFLKRVPKGQTLTIGGKEYKPGQFLPPGDFEHYKLLPTDSVPGKPISDSEATKVNDPVN